MKIFALLDENNIVVNISVGDNNWSHPDWIASNDNNPAGIGHTYDETRKAFIPPQCHDVATLDEVTYLWICNDKAHDVPD